MTLDKRMKEADGGDALLSCLFSRTSLVASVRWVREEGEGQWVQYFVL